MKLDSKIRYRCRECGNSSDSDHYPLRFCPECKKDGTVYVIGESVLATAIEVTDDAPRSSRSDEGRSPFEDGQAPLLDGLVELKRLVDEADDEAWSLFDKWPTHDDSVMREISSRLRVVATMLAQAKERFEHKGAISPARSVRMSDRENNE